MHEFLNTLDYLYLYIGVGGLPFIVVIFGILLIKKRINKPVGIFLFITLPFTLLTMLLVEAAASGLVPLLVGSVLIITGIYEISKCRNERRAASLPEVSDNDNDSEEADITDQKILKKRQRESLFVAILIIVFGAFFVSFAPVKSGVIDPYNIEYVRTQNEIRHKEYPVTMAVYKQDMRELEALLQGGADPNEMMDGIPLMKRVLIQSYAPDKRSTIFRICQLLIEGGYDVGETDDKAATLLMYATIDSRATMSLSSKHYSSEEFDKYNLPYLLTELFIDHGADVNACDTEGRTALMWACNYRKAIYDQRDDIETAPFIVDNSEYYSGSSNALNFELMNCLIDNGADVNAWDKNGYQAIDYFHFAVEENSKDNSPYGLELYNSKEYLYLCKAIEELLLSEPISQSEAMTRASEHFPEGARFTYTGKERISVAQIVGAKNNPINKAKLCYIFDVVYEEQYVSSVAVEIIDGAAWFLDSDEDEMDDSKPWISENPFEIDEELSEEALAKEIENE